MGGKEAELEEDEVLVFTSNGDKEERQYHFKDANVIYNLAGAFSIDRFLNLIQVHQYLLIFYHQKIYVANRYPMEINITGYDLEENEKNSVKEKIVQAAADLSIDIEEMLYYTDLSCTVYKDKENLNIEKADGMNTPKGKISIVEWITLEDYQRMGGKEAGTQNTNIT